MKKHNNVRARVVRDTCPRRTIRLYRWNGGEEILTNTTLHSGYDDENAHFILTIGPANREVPRRPPGCVHRDEDGSRGHTRNAEHVCRAGGSWNDCRAYLARHGWKRVPDHDHDDDDDAHARQTVSHHPTRNPFGGQTRRRKRTETGVT